MAKGFGRRLQLAKELEHSFIESFNANCHTHKMVKFGIESTQLNEAHGHLRFKRDDTSRFLRYMPDSVLIGTQNSDAQSALVEFKVAERGVEEQSFFNRLKANCPDMDPPFSEITDVFNVESEALNGYIELAKLGVPVIVVGWAKFKRDNPLRAQFADAIAVCNEYDPNRSGEPRGSGTWLYNTNFASFEPVVSFLEKFHGIDPAVMVQVENSVLGRPS